MNPKSTKKKGSAKVKPMKAPSRKEPARTTAKVLEGKKPSRGAERTQAVASVPAPSRPARPVPAPAERKEHPKPAPARLSRRDLEHFRKLLLEKQGEFTEAYRVSKGDSRSNLDNGTEDYIDYAVSSYAKEFLLSLSEMDRKQLLLVQEALKRIDRGEYGFCLQCSQEIVRKRLEVAPWARHCVRCQELEERGLLPQYPHAAEGEDLQEAALGLDDEEYEAPTRPQEEEEEEEEGIETDHLIIEAEDEEGEEEKEKEEEEE